MNTSNYDPKTKDNNYSNNTSFSSNKFASLVNNAITNLSGKFVCTPSYDTKTDINTIYLLPGWWNNGADLADYKTILNAGEEGTFIPISVSNGTFTLKGSNINAFFASYSTTVDAVFAIPTGNGDYVYNSISIDSFADWFNGTIPVESTTSEFITEDHVNVNLRFQLINRVETISTDSVSSDITLTFAIVEENLAKLVLTYDTLTSKNNTCEIDLGCLSSYLISLENQVLALTNRVAILEDQNQ